MSQLDTTVLRAAPPTVAPPAIVHCYAGNELEGRLPHLEAFLLKSNDVPLSLHPRWLNVLQRGQGHTPYCIEVTEGAELKGYLPLAYVSSWLFGRFLVSMPYLNYGGVVAADPHAERQILDRAVQLADSLDVRYLELRHTNGLDHPALQHRLATKVHMRLRLPNASESLWTQLNAKVRNQIRKGQKGELSVAWGGLDLLPDFYAVFARNMRDLGTPVFGKNLFASILQTFPDRTEFCVVRQGTQPIAAALLLHGWGVTEVPSASSLRAYSSTSANMLMYWHLLQRSIERGQHTFDFGRSTMDGSTYQFKKQWGAKPFPADWQFYLRHGDTQDMRPDRPRYQQAIQVWKRLPVFLTRLLGPMIVRGIP